MPAPVKATIFAYQVGFGDCFLLRYNYKDGQRRHLLIDFGTTGLPEDVASNHMLEVANDIAKKCREGEGDGIDVLVATHRHADHISGFATRDDGTGPGDVIASLHPKVVVQPWTEAADAPLDWLGPEESDADHQALTARWASLQAMQVAAGQSLAFTRAHDKNLPQALSGQLNFIGEDNLSNLSAVKNLQGMGDRRGSRHCYAYHGCDLGLDTLLPGIEVHVLGPPTLRQTETIRKQRSRDKDEFWMLQPKRLADAAGASSSKTIFPDASYLPGTKLFTEQRWLAHRINELNGEVMLSLVRALDKQMNNTSVILLMKAGSKSLLFPGDAQIENWEYALQSPLAKLLDEVDLYKVGHHGSRNATPRSMWNRFRKRGSGRRSDRLQSVLSTKKGKHGSESKHTEVPRVTLLAQLKAKSKLYSTEDLHAGELHQTVELDLTT